MRGQLTGHMSVGVTVKIASNDHQMSKRRIIVVQSKGLMSFIFLKKKEKRLLKFSAKGHSTDTSGKIDGYLETTL